MIESPYAGDRETNDRYLDEAIGDCVRRGESPYASHALLTRPGVLDDGIPGDRDRGIAAGCAWRDAAEATVVYTDLGISSGMRRGIDDAKFKGQPIEYRQLPGWGVSCTR